MKGEGRQRRGGRAREGEELGSEDWGRGGVERMGRGEEVREHSQILPRLMPLVNMIAYYPAHRETHQVGITLEPP